MQTTLPGLLLLEVLDRAEEKKNTAGKYELTGNLIPYAILYPFGQSIKFGPPEVLSMKVTDEEAKRIKPLIGKIVTVECDQRKGKNGSYYVYTSMAPHHV